MGKVAMETSGARGNATESSVMSEGRDHSKASKSSRARRPEGCRMQELPAVTDRWFEWACLIGLWVITPLDAAIRGNDVLG